MIVRDVPDIDLVRAGIRHHHERWDGDGYLDRLAGEEIPLIARILAVGDAFSAMTTTRPYRKALDLREALTPPRGRRRDPARRAARRRRSSRASRPTPTRRCRASTRPRVALDAEARRVSRRRHAAALAVAGGHRPVRSAAPRSGRGGRRRDRNPRLPRRSSMTPSRASPARRARQRRRHPRDEGDPRYRRQPRDPAPRRRRRLPLRPGPGLRRHRHLHLSRQRADPARTRRPSRSTSRTRRPWRGTTPTRRRPAQP